MLKKIIVFETLLNLTSFRFQLVVGLFAVVFFGGLFVNIGNYKARLSEHSEIAAAADPFNVGAPPNPLCVFAEGTDAYSSMAITLDNIQVGQVQAKYLGKDTSTLRIASFGSLDFNFAVKVLLSLGAIVITFASVSGDRFAGTLKLVCASGVSRRHLILGKLFASFLCLATPLVICLVVSCIILALNDMLTSWAEVVRVALFLLFSLIYALFFALVGLTISVVTKRPQESLVSGVLVWLALVFVLPTMMPQVSRLFADTPSSRGLEEARQIGWIATAFEHDHSDRRDLFDARMQQKQDAYQAAWEVANNQLANHAKVKGWLDLLSPADMYNDASMGIVGNGIQNALHAKATILQHKTNVLNDPMNSQFVFQRRGLASDFPPALLAIFILCLEAGVLLLFAYHRFMLLDLREG